MTFVSMKDICTLYKLTRTGDPFGGYEHRYADSGNVWARIMRKGKAYKAAFRLPTRLRAGDVIGCKGRFFKVMDKVDRFCGNRYSEVTVEEENAKNIL